MKINEGNPNKDSNLQSNEKEGDVMDKYNDNKYVKRKTTRKNFNCNHEGCNKRFSSNRRLKIHIQTHVT